MTSIVALKTSSRVLSRSDRFGMLAERLAPEFAETLAHQGRTFLGEEKLRALGSE